MSDLREEIGLGVARPHSGKTMTVLFGFLFLLTCFLTLWVSSLVFTFNQSDPPGDAMSEGFAFLGAIVLWIIAAGLLIVCGMREGFEGPGPLIVLAFFIAAVSGHVAALNILSDLHKGDRFLSLLRCVTVAIPCAVLAFSAWSFFLPLRSIIPAGIAYSAFGLSMIAMSVIPWMVRGPSRADRAAKNKPFLEAWERQQQLIKEVDALPADTVFTDFLPYAYESYDRSTNVPDYLHSAAVGRMRRVPNRQAEVERLLNNSDARLLGDLDALDIQMTPAICEGGKKSARAAADKIAGSDLAPSFEDFERSVTPYIVGIRWLAKNNCDCKPELASIEQTARRYPFSYPRKWFIDSLLELQGKPPED
jgi:hypothetical protein